MVPRYWEERMRETLQRLKLQAGPVAYADSGHVLWPQCELRQTEPPNSPPACLLSGPAGTQTGGARG